MAFDVGEVEARHETERALLVVARDDRAEALLEAEGGEAWVPKSQIDEDSEVWKGGQEGRLVVTAWLARKKGWEDE